MKRFAFLTLALLSLLPASAIAQTDARDVSVARREFQTGVEAARAGDWETARDHFARSYEINPRLSALLNLAGAQVQTGQLVEAAESYREYLGRRDEASAANAAEAERLLVELEARIPTLRLRVDGLAETDEVRLDDSPLNRLLIGEQMPLNPGPHRAFVLRDGAEVAEQSVEAAEGDRLERTLIAPPPAREPEPDPPADVSPTAAARTVATEPLTTGDPVEPTGDNVLEQWWFWTILGVVVVGGVVLGVALAVTPGQAPDSVGFERIPPLEVP